MRRLGRTWLIAIFLLSALDAAAAEPRRVLLLHSFGPHFPPWNTISTRLREELRKQSPYPVDLYEASLQGERFGEAQDERPFLDYLRALFAGRDLDLVVAMGAPAARFFLRNRPNLFPSTPLLIAGTDERTFSQGMLTPNDATVTVAFDQSLQIDNILQILPDTTDIAVAIGNSQLEKFWQAELRPSFQRFTNRVTFHWLNELSADEMVKRVRELPQRSAIYYATVRVDARGEPQEEDRVLARFRELGRAPIFSYIDSNFGLGIVGGPMLSSGDVAMKSAEVAVRILKGETPGSIKTAALGLGTPVYDWRELQRWKIDEALLPPGSIVHFRQPTAWETYRWQIVLVLAAILIQAAMIAWLLYEHRRRRIAEITTQSTMSRLTHLNRVATAGELSASIAHEVNQPLAGIAASASAALRWLAAETPDLDRARAALGQVVNASHRAAEIVTTIRAMFKKESGERAPVDINKLIQAILAIGRVEMAKAGIELQTELAENLPDVECNPVQMQQVILNLVMNAVEAMHTTPRRVLRIESKLSEPGVVRVSIEDTGVGIDPSNLDRIFNALVTTKEGGMGMGLSICRSIVESHKGRIWALPGATQGSIFQLELPTAGARGEFAPPSQRQSVDSEAGR